MIICHPSDIYAFLAPISHISPKETHREFLPVQCIECLFTALHITFKRLLLCVHSNVDFEAVRGKKGFATAFLIADKSVFPTMCLLVSAQVSSSAIGSWTALKSALVSLNLWDRNVAWFDSFLIIPGIWRQRDGLWCERKEKIKQFSYQAT